MGRRELRAAGMQCSEDSPNEFLFGVRLNLFHS